jgi:hypothetical protein
MHAAGRLHDPSGEGLIKHGTVRTPKTDCPFVVFDVEAGSWEELHLMTDAWMLLLGGLAVGTAVKFGSDFAPTAWTDSSGKLKKLFQFGSMKNGDALVGHEELETPIDKEDVQVHRIEEGALSIATDKKDSPDELFKKPAHLRRCGDKKAKAMVAAMEKDEKHRRLLDLPTEEGGSLDEDVKAERVDFYSSFYYEEKKREREEKKREKREEKKRKYGGAGNCLHGRRKRQCKHCGTASASTGAGRASARTAAGAIASTGAGRARARTAARGDASTGAMGASARTAARANASTGSGRATARTAARQIDNIQ